MTPKFIVWCGQDLNPEDERGFLFPQSGHREFILPEKDGGPNYLRNLVNDVIMAGIPTVFVTRFEFVVSEFALNVSRKTITRDDVVFRLVHEDRTWSEHRMDVGLEFIGDNWPFGVLW
jgi:hypothetical protein